MTMTTHPDLRAAAEHALKTITIGNLVGLGTGHAAEAFIKALGERARAGLTVRAVATSHESAQLADKYGIARTNLDEIESIDVTVDGADEVDPACNLIKGYGGALVREKIVAASSRRLIIIVGPEKLVPVLGSRGILPVEVVPFGVGLCRRQLTQLGFAADLRMHDKAVFVTDNGNHILDCRVPPLVKPSETEQAIRAIPGVVGTGLFLGMASMVLIQTGNSVETRQPRQ
jgi:ribose 5-phosphate isomerase A